MADNNNLNLNNLDKLFCDFRRIDMKVINHRKKINRLSDSEFQSLLHKRYGMHQAMVDLNLMGEYFDWLKKMGI